MRKSILFFAAVAATLLASCATLPDVTMTYYLARSEASFKVVRTVACDAANNPIVATSVAPTVRHFADVSEAHTISLVDLRGPLTDSDVKIELYEDGRLKAMNATVTGQGEAILKAAITLLGAAIVALEAAPDYSRECAFIQTAGGGKPLTLTYVGTVSLDSDAPQKIAPDAASGSYAQQLVGAIGDVCARVLRRNAPAAPATTPAVGTRITLRQPGEVAIRVSVGHPDCETTSVWEGAVLAGQHGVEYRLPVPKPAAFGKQVFGVAVAESGALQSAQYVSNSNAAQAIGVANAALTAAQGETIAQAAAAAKAEADLIAQQQRLVRCRADPANCS